MYKINLSRKGVAAEICWGISDYVLENRKEIYHYGLPVSRPHLRGCHGGWPQHPPVPSPPC